MPAGREFSAALKLIGLSALLLTACATAPAPMSTPAASPTASASVSSSPLPSLVPTTEPTAVPTAAISPSPSAAVATPVPSASLPPSPEPPGNLRLVEVSSSQVTVKWDFSPHASHYRVYRNSKAVATEHTFPNYYIYTDLSPGAEYVFGVQAVNASGASRIVTLKQEVPYNGRSGNDSF